VKEEKIMARLSILGVLAMLSLALLGHDRVHAQDTETPTAAIHAGTCGEIGEELVSLNEPRAEGGNWVGQEGLAPILESDTENLSEISATQLTDSPHAIVIHAGDTPVACGEIGGPVDDGDLILAVHPVDASGYFGIADIDGFPEGDDDDGDDVEVHLYLVQPAG
jgi:hypothetical protein